VSNLAGLVAMAATVELVETETVLRDSIHGSQEIRRLYNQDIREDHRWKSNHNHSVL